MLAERESMECTWGDVLHCPHAHTFQWTKLHIVHRGAKVQMVHVQSQESNGLWRASTFYKRSFMCFERSPSQHAQRERGGFLMCGVLHSHLTCILRCANQFLHIIVSSELGRSRRTWPLQDLVLTWRSIMCNQNMAHERQRLTSSFQQSKRHLPLLFGAHNRDVNVSWHL